MNILYEGFYGNAGVQFFGWVLIIIGILFFIGSIICLLTSIEDFGELSICLLGLASMIVLSGLAVKTDWRYPVIKATINEKVSWQEINDKYELINQQDQIYTFKVKNMTNQEWENHLKEKENK